MLFLVTGATGFIGSHLVSRLISEGHQVRALARETSNCSYLEHLGVEVMRGSLLDEKLISSACTGVDVVFNLAGKIGGPGVEQAELIAANVTSVKVLLQASQSKGISQFIHCSTPGVFGMDGIASENMPYRPVGTYESSKCEGEQVIKNFSIGGQVPTTIIRPDFVYGPGDTHKLKLFRMISKGLFPLIGRGWNLVRPTYVEDVIDGMMITVGNPYAYGDSFNIAGPEPVTISELALTIAKALGVKVPKYRLPVKAARLAAAGSEALAAVLGRKPLVTQYQVSFFSRDHAADISKARKILGFDPKVPLAEGIQKTVKWYRQENYI